MVPVQFTQCVVFIPGSLYLVGGHARLPSAEPLRLIELESFESLCVEVLM